MHWFILLYWYHVALLWRNMWPILIDVISIHRYASSLVFFSIEVLRWCSSYNIQLCFSIVIYNLFHDSHPSSFSVRCPPVASEVRTKVLLFYHQFTAYWDFVYFIVYGKLRRFIIVQRLYIVIRTILMGSITYFFYLIRLSISLSLSLSLSVSLCPALSLSVSFSHSLLVCSSLSLGSINK